MRRHSKAGSAIPLPQQLDSAVIAITDTTTRKTLLFFMFLPNFQYLDRVAVTRRFPPSLQHCRDNHGVQIRSIWR